jgi:hypothetical protein
MFVTTVIFGIIVIAVGGGGNDGAVGVPCRGSLLRDIAVLVLVCVISMWYLRCGIIDIGFVYVMLGIYACYVMLVLFADAHHVFYHVPRRTRMEEEEEKRKGKVGMGASMDDEGMGECEGAMGTSPPAVAMTSTRMTDEGARDGSSSVPNDRTPLMYSSSSSLPPPSHRHPRKHSHTLGETVIVAISNYSCAEEDEVGEKMEEKVKHRHRTAIVDRWAPVQDDGTEPLVTFHPNHGVHPHHPGGPSLLRMISDDGTARSVSAAAIVRLHSSSFSDDGGAATTRPPSTSSVEATSYIECDIAIRGGGAANAEGDRMANSSFPPHSVRPNSWKEAYHANATEFSEHWRDFFNGIYSKNRNQDTNDDNSLWEIIALTVELPFTIARKVGLSLIYCSPVCLPF